jgi:hypothetical protein
MKLKRLALKFIPHNVRAHYNKRYRIFHFIHKSTPVLFKKRIYEYLKNRSPEKRPSILSKLAASTLIDIRPEDDTLTLAIAQQFSEASMPYLQYRIGDRMLRGRLYGERLSAFLKGATDHNQDVYATFRYLDYLTQVRGYRDPDVARIAKRFAKGHIQRAMTRSQKVKASVILLRTGQADLAEKIYGSIPEGIVRQRELPLYLQRNAFNLKWRHWEALRRGAEQFAKMASGRKAFAALIRESRHSFCIVGNGPSEIGRARGHLIDRHDVVIRMNSYDMDHVEDYGTKQTVWARVPNEEADAAHISNNRFLILVSNQFEYKRTDAETYLHDACSRNMDILSAPPEIFMALIRELNCLPSTGLVLLYWLYTLTGPIPRDRIFGFSHFEELADFRSHYYTDKVHRRLHVHAWEKEMTIMARITI